MYTTFYFFLTGFIRIFNQRDPFQYSKLFVLKLKPNVAVFAFLGLPAVFQVGIFCCSFVTEVIFFLSSISLKITAFLDSTGVSSSSSLAGVNWGVKEGLTEGDAEGERLRLADETETEGEALPAADGEAEGLAEGEALPAGDGLTLELTDGETLPTIDGLADGETEGEALPAIDGLTLGETEAEGLSDGEADGLALGEALGLTEAEGLCEGDAEGDTDADGDTEALGD